MLDLDRFAGGNAKRVAGGLQGVAALAAVLSAYIHLELWNQGFRHIHVIGALFMLNAIGGFAIGLLAVLWRNPIIALLAGGFGGSTVGAYYLALTRGMFGFKEVRGGMAQQVAEIAEWIGFATGGLAFVIGALLWLHSRSSRPVGAASKRRFGHRAQERSVAARGH